MKVLCSSRTYYSFDMRGSLQVLGVILATLLVLAELLARRGRGRALRCNAEGVQLTRSRAYGCLRGSYNSIFKRSGGWDMWRSVEVWGR